MRSVLLGFTAAALTVPIVAAIPHAPNPITAKGSQSGLIARDDISDEDKIGYLIYSHGCFAAGSGFPQCRDLTTMKWGKEGEYKDCNDDSVDSAFEEFCDIKGSDMVTLDTPMGEGIFQPDKDCGKGGKEGLIITAMNDVSSSGYECVRDDHEFSEWCGFTWASHSVMKCTYKGEF